MITDPTRQIPAHVSFFRAGPFVIRRLSPWPNQRGAPPPQTPAEIAAYIRENAATIFHPVGTASMTPRGASWGVVDPDLVAKGISGLRIVDASVLVRVPCSPFGLRR